MIKIVNGDLLQATEDIIGHQVNCQKKMRSGVALQIKKRFPTAFKKYIEFTNTIKEEMHESPLGMINIVHAEGKIIANLFGQDDYGDEDGNNGNQYTDVKALKECFETLHYYAKSWGLSLALPYNIGCDRGGANWGEVYAILENIFDDYDLTLYKR